MKSLKEGTGLWLAGLVTLTLCAQGGDARDRATPSLPESPQQDAAPRLVVGTYDSRGIALAYIRSAGTGEYLRAQKEDVGRATQRAREAGDLELAAGLDALGPAMQLRFHRQGFGTAPVDDILARIGERLPAIAHEAGVDVIVSKWALTYQDPSARFVDVTERLAAEFEPSEDTWKAIRQIVETEPVPLDQIREEG